MRAQRRGTAEKPNTEAPEQPAGGQGADGNEADGHVAHAHGAEGHVATGATLRRTWVTSALQLVVIIMGLGTLAVTTTWYSRSLFHEATSHVELEISSLSKLKTSMSELSVAARPVLYGLEGAGTAEERLAAYETASARVDEDFATVESIFRGGAESQTIVQAMVQNWQALDGEVSAVPSLGAAGLAEVLAGGVDPFEETFWLPYNRIDQHIGQLSNEAVIELRARISKFDRVYGVIAPTVVVAMLLALAMSWMTARRVARRVLTPLVTLRNAAVALRESHLDHQVVLPGAASELHELARTLNETSASLRATHEELRGQAGSDSLTGLPNRRAFTELLVHTLADADGGGVGVLFIDLDDFKIVNDSLGHAAGDELLRIVAGRLNSVTRGGETVARLGGDEFAIMVNTDAAPTAAIAVAERALAALDDRVVIDGSSVSVGCSIGLAVSPGGGGAGAADELLRNADFAMYMAKSQGKNRFEVFAPAMHAEMLARLELKTELGQAVQLGQFELAYQPVIELRTGALLGFEALIRWQHPTRGLLAPSEFIPLAEDTTDILAIGKWVIDEACRALAGHHRRQGPDERPLWMSINVSPLEITRPGFLDTVKNTLERHGLSPEALVVEITEGVAMTNTQEAAEVLSALRATGVLVALDDFGTGFSSLRSLKELPVDVIKIDRSFLANAVDGSDAASMLEGIVTLGRSLGVEIIAEGIETASQLDRLVPLGIAGQGFLFARPLSPTAAADFRERATSDRAVEAKHSALPSL